MSKAALAVITAMALAGTGLIDERPFFNNGEPKEPKNKHNLTPDEVEQMESMTPKEKKKFLKQRNPKCQVIT